MRYLHLQQNKKHPLQGRKVVKLWMIHLKDLQWSMEVRSVICVMDLRRRTRAYSPRRLRGRPASRHFTLRPIPNLQHRWLPPPRFLLFRGTEIPSETVIPREPAIIETPHGVHWPSSLENFHTLWTVNYFVCECTQKLSVLVSERFIASNSAFFSCGTGKFIYYTLLT